MRLPPRTLSFGRGPGWTQDQTGFHPAFPWKTALHALTFPVLFGSAGAAGCCHLAGDSAPAPVPWLSGKSWRASSGPMLCTDVVVHRGRARRESGSGPSLAIGSLWCWRRWCWKVQRRCWCCPAGADCRGWSGRARYARSALSLAVDGYSGWC